MNEVPIEPFPVPDASGLGLSWVVVFLLVLIAVATLLHRRYGQPVRGDALRMVSSLSLGDTRAIVMIEADNERLLVGVTSSNVRLISRLESGEASGTGRSTEDTFEAMQAASKRKGSLETGFTGTFRSLLRAASVRKART